MNITPDVFMLKHMHSLGLAYNEFSYREHLAKTNAIFFSGVCLFAENV